MGLELFVYIIWKLLDNHKKNEEERKEKDRKKGKHYRVSIFEEK